MAFDAGSDLSIVSWSRRVHVCVQAAEQGVPAQVIDLRTIWPWSRKTVLASAERSGRAHHGQRRPPGRTAHPGGLRAGAGSRIAHRGGAGGAGG